MLTRTERQLVTALTAACGFGVAVGVAVAVVAVDSCGEQELCSFDGGGAALLLAGVAALAFTALLLPWLAVIALRAPAGTCLAYARRATWLATVPALVLLPIALALPTLAQESQGESSAAWWLVRALVVAAVALPLLVGPRRWRLFVPLASVLAAAAVGWAWYLVLPAPLLIAYACALGAAAIFAVAPPLQRRRTTG